MASTRDTAEPIDGAAEPMAVLLDAMTDEELARYGEIARDQVERELRRRWLQIVLSLGALGTFAWGTWGFLLAGFGRSVVLAIGMAAALGYWPYRKAKTRRLWKRHCEVVEAELIRRRSGGAGEQHRG